MNDERPARRRSSFEKDLREFVLKVFLGVAAGLALSYAAGWKGPLWGPLVVGVIAVFMLASVIRGSGRDSD